ncbi:MAG: ABC transporter substrate-binding protein [Acidimicrobiia bacterium]|nr:ABC transporter substrate-binding protein [Acidimicrobiia bacterium]
MLERWQTSRMLTAIAVVIVLLAAACGGGGSGDTQEAVDDEAETTGTTVDPGPPQPGGKVVYGLLAETNNWDPTAGNWAPWSLIVANAMFDTLSRYNEDGTVEPYLAEGFYPATGNQQWRIKTREGVTFHNGEDFDAEALAQNINFHRESPLTGSVFERVTEVEVIDDRNVRIALSEPLAQFPRSSRPRWAS